MNLRAIANPVTSQINPNVAVTVRPSVGYTVGAGFKQTPTYAADVTGMAQIQALDGDMLKHVDGLNLQGDIRSIYLYGNLAAVVRPDSKGGDLVIVDTPAPVFNRGTWLVVKVIETWPDWTHALIIKQVV